MHLNVFVKIINVAKMKWHTGQYYVVLLKLITFAFDSSFFIFLGWTTLFPLSTLILTACADSEGGGKGSGTPSKSQNIVFPSNTGPDPLKNHKTTKTAFNVGPSSARQRNAI